jgi:hypothetical protein
LVGSRRRAALFAVCATLLVPSSAGAATLSVDDDLEECPAAGFTSVQSAVNAAASGDTVAICPGNYLEGPGTPSNNALTITKSLTINGAGADLVTIGPPAGSESERIAANTPILRDTTGNIVTVTGTPSAPLEVDISGVTIDGNGIYAENGLVFLDASGSVVRSRVTDIVVSEQAGAEDLPGGYRQNNHGFGIAQVTAAPGGSAPTVRPLVVDHTRVDKYNKAGILVDGATGDATPLTASGITGAATVSASQVVGRTRCVNFDTNGNCTGGNLAPITTGTTYGQDAIRVTAGSTADVADSILTQNIVNGSGAPLPSTISNAGVVTPNSTNNANLPQAAGIRLIGAGASTVTHTNLVGNSYGAVNVGLDGTTANTATPLDAEDNWWGLRAFGTPASTPPVNNGPAISPPTNPIVPENPVNGAPAPDGANTTSDAVDFYPYRAGQQADPSTGEFPVVDAPIPVNDGGPSVTLSSDAATYERGEAVALTADAADDFGVNAVTFYDGATPIGSDATPPYEASFELPGDAPCGARAFTAIATDSLGQTASDVHEVTVTEAANCLAAPTIALVDPPARIGQDGATVRATVSSPAKIQSVAFFLGSRRVCVVPGTDTYGEYEESPGCEILPLGSEVGSQAIAAVATDEFGRTAVATADTVVDRFDPRKLTAKATKKKVKGSLKLPARVEPVDGCASGSVTVKVKAKGAGTLLPSVQLALTPKCKYAVPLKFKGPKKKLRVKARFGGNEVLNPISSRRSK